MFKPVLVFTAGILMVAMLAVCPQAQPVADYGDLGAPYPSAYAAQGPFHLTTTHEWIGSTSVSLTSVESDALVPDNDFDDGFIEIDNLMLGGVFSEMAMVRVPVTTDATTATRYLNVVADLNGDGSFQTFPDPGSGREQYEWLVCNHPVVHVDETKVITSYFVLLTQAVSVGPRRATLTTYPISPSLYGNMGWNGTGPAVGFARGETEDFTDPYYCDNLEWYPEERGVVYYTPNDDEITTFAWQWPPAGNRPVIDAPRKWNNGGAGNGELPPDVENPVRPADPVAPRPPQRPGAVTTPPGFNLDSPVVDTGSVKGMPDIKQGKNECVPTATANSIRYLMDQEGLSQEVIDSPYASSSDDLNKKLQEALKASMKTDNESGTNVDSKGKNDDFRKGKKNCPGLPSNLKTADGENKVSTEFVHNPSYEAIKEAIDKGMDVEINVQYYDNETREPNGKGHMVTVVGYAVHEDGTLELMYHDPAVKKNGESAGDTVKPPRVQRCYVTNGSTVKNKGGLVVHGGSLDKPGETAVIHGACMETLSNEKNDGAGTHSDAPPDVPAGSQANLMASHTRSMTRQDTGDVEYFTGFYYLWLHEGNQIAQTYEPTLTLENLQPEDSGDYAVWIYDLDNNLYEQATTTTLRVFPLLDPAGAKNWESLK